MRKVSKHPNRRCKPPNSSLNTSIRLNHKCLEDIETLNSGTPTNMHPHVVRMINVCQLVIQRDLVKLLHQHDYPLFFSGTFTNIIFQSKSVTFHGESLKHKRCRPSESILTLASRTKRPWNTALWHRNAVLVFCHLPATPLVFKSTNISLP